MNKKNQFFFDNEWQKSQSKKKFQYTNSKNKTISIINNDKKDIQKILISSENGFKIWKKTSYLERSKIINKIGKLILKNIRILAKKRLLIQENHFSNVFLK